MTDDKLTRAETASLAECEAVIERGLKTFVEVGEALLRVRDERLYRATHPTFEHYCRERWGFGGRRARQLMAASEVGTIVPVENEGQARELLTLLRDRGEQAVVSVYRELRREHGDDVTAYDVRRGVESFLNRKRRDRERRSEAERDETYKKLRVHFEGPEDYVDFLRLIGRLDHLKTSAKDIRLGDPPDSGDETG